LCIVYRALWDTSTTQPNREPCPTLRYACEVEERRSHNRYRTVIIEAVCSVHCRVHHYAARKYTREVRTAQPLGTKREACASTVASSGASYIGVNNIISEEPPSRRNRLQTALTSTRRDDRQAAEPSDAFHLATAAGSGAVRGRGGVPAVRACSGRRRGGRGVLSSTCHLDLSRSCH
jgi:hypothetical protein